MVGPVTIHHHENTIRKKLRVTDCPDGCNYPIRGLPWDVVHHQDYVMTVQEEAFLGNHMQVIELEATDEISLRFTIEVPSVFMVVMMEGFVKFHKEDRLISYTMGGAMYMTYNPRADFSLQASTGKHAMMVVSIEKSWFLAAGRIYSNFDTLVRSQENESAEPIILPMCRLAQPIADLWDSMRIIRSRPILRKAELVTDSAKLMDFYHSQLEEGNWLKGQLSVEIANCIVMYIERNYAKDTSIPVADLADEIGISRHKLEEYAYLLFGKTLHKYIRDLRMAKAARLLRETNIPVTAISFKVGYSNSSHFFKIFDAYFDVPPAKYRIKHRKH